jgi:hypothetical protein
VGVAMEGDAGGMSVGFKGREKVFNQKGHEG